MNTIDSIRNETCSISISGTFEEGFKPTLVIVDRDAEAVIADEDPEFIVLRGSGSVDDVVIPRAVADRIMLAVERHDDRSDAPAGVGRVA